MRSVRKHNPDCSTLEPVKVDIQFENLEIEENVKEFLEQAQNLNSQIEVCEIVDEALIEIQSVEIEFFEEVPIEKKVENVVEEVIEELPVEPDIQQVVNEVPAKNKFICYYPKCSKSQLTLPALRSHIRSTHEEKVCSTCKLKVIGKFNLRQDMFEQHKKKFFECDFCGYRVRDKTGINNHLNPHDSEDPIFYECKCCDKKFKTKVSLSHHNDTCHSSKSYTCDKCQKIFPNRQYFISKRHRMACDNLIRNKIKCKFCPKSYAPSTILHHQLIEHQD
jgi:hypothetical protein